MPEVRVKYKNMNDKELDSVAEAMADMIIGHIQDKKKNKLTGKSVQKSKKQLQESSDGNLQPV